MTLTEVSYYTRKLFPIVATVSVFLILFYFLTVSFVKYYQSTRQKTVPINPVFGKLTKIKLSTGGLSYPIEANFNLDNIEGRPTEATSAAKVFFLPAKTTRFGYLEKIYLMAKTLGFDTEIIKHKLDSTRAIFEDSEKKLVVDIADFNFEYGLKGNQKKDFLEDATIPEDNRLRDSAKNFLGVLGKYSTELTKGYENTVYLTLDENGEFIATENIEIAKAAEVDFFRADIGDIPVVSAKFPFSHNFVAMVFKNNAHQILKAQIKFFERDKENFGIYPLKSGQTAFEELKNHKGIILSLGKNKNQFTIRKMFLAYFEPDIYQEYLQPVFVFVGDSGFAAIVPAVQKEYIEN